MNDDGKVVHYDFGKRGGPLHVVDPNGQGGGGTSPTFNAQAEQQRLITSANALNMRYGDLIEHYTPGMLDDQRLSYKTQDVINMIGTGHLYLRGPMETLIRLGNNKPDTKKAAVAYNTVDFALQKPEKFIGDMDHTRAVADLSEKLLTAEMAGNADLKSLITDEQVDQLVNGINYFYEVVKNERNLNAERAVENQNPVIERYAADLQVVVDNALIQATAIKMKLSAGNLSLVQSNGTDGPQGGTQP